MREWWNAGFVAIATLLLVLMVTGCAMLIWRTSDDEVDKEKTTSAAVAVGSTVEGPAPPDKNDAILALLRELESRIAAIEGALDVGGSEP